MKGPRGEKGHMRDPKYSEEEKKDAVDRYEALANEGIRRVREGENVNSDAIQDLIQRLRKTERILKRMGAKFRRFNGFGRTTDQSGTGDGTTDEQLEQKMRPYEHRGFSGVIASDEIKDLKDYTKSGNEMSFIMNLDNSKQPGSHWVPVYIRWGNTKSGGPEVDYADSFGDPPSKSTVSQLKELVKSRGAPYMLKMKVNRLKEQRENSDTCGGHSMRFLADMYAGKTFKEATGYTVERAEHLAKKMEGRGGVPRFGYI